MSQESRTKKLEEIELLQKQLVLREGLPFLHGWKWYPWAREFYESVNKTNLLCAANQISKSSTQIRKVLNWATDKSLWPELWAHVPNQFWYLYPTSNQATIEFETKWKQFLPRGTFKDDPVYGWREEKKHGEIFAVHFHSGLHLYFKTYAQNLISLQTGTVDAIFCFVAGTQVVTPHGVKKIEQIQPYDLILSKDGWAPVQTTMYRPQPILVVHFSNGERLEGTAEHPVWTGERGWVPLGALQRGDSCVTVPGWKILKKLFYSKESYSHANQSTPTPAQGTILSVGVNAFMWRYGVRTIRSVCQRVLLSTIATITRLTIGSKIYSSLAGLSTPDSIRRLNGERKKSTPASVKHVESPLFHEAQNEVSLGAAPHGVGSLHTKLSGFVRFVTRILSTVRITNKNFVLGVAQTGREERVYNLTVGGSNTYFANGILTHNCDEELPMELYDELIFRLSRTNGYFHMVFTATMGQDFWRRAMEPIDEDDETLKSAFKKCVSLYDSQSYEDGTPSYWVDEKIKMVEGRCSSHAEILRRVWGRFVLDTEGRKYPQFDMKRHMKKPHPIPATWSRYGIVDPGGGEGSHPAGILFLAVNPEKNQGRVYRTWRGDHVLTTAEDVLKKFIELRDEDGYPLEQQIYDWQAKDFHTFATRASEPFQKANKDHDQGEDIVNALFKNDMLFIYEGPEEYKLAKELSSLRKNTPKRHAKDDLIDPLRYGCCAIPWDFKRLKGEVKDVPEKTLNAKQQELADRRKAFEDGGESAQAKALEDEFSEWNEAYGGGADY